MFMPNQFSSFKNNAKSLTIILTLYLTGCTTTLTSPYSDKLAVDTEQFYKNSATVLEEGRTASPKTDFERAKITHPENNAGSYSKFESQYNRLIIDSKSLILLALANDEKIGLAGQRLQSKLNDIVSESLPAKKCDEIKNDIDANSTTLLVGNYIDLKCILTGWKEQHADPQFTQNTLILKKSNWEARKKQLFNIVLILQKSAHTKEPR
ncbi:hypothetical protein ACB524_004401 [Salmonella enterica]